MKYDLTQIDFKKEITQQLKVMYIEKVEAMLKNKEVASVGEKLILFHGTSLHYFNDILMYGLLRRNITGVSNFGEKIKSNENSVYLSKKWHYWYAYNSYNNLLNNGIKDMNIPCYIECEVPVSSLVPDEDFFHSKYVLNKIKTCLKEDKQFLELKYDECLNHYGTVAHLGNIQRDDIVAITILANEKLFLKNFIDYKCQYYKDLQKWGNGKGKGVLKFIDLLKLEDDKYNLTFQLKDVPAGNIIDGIKLNKEQDKYVLHFNKPKTANNI